MIDRSSGITKSTLCLLLTAVVMAVTSVITHTHVHLISQITFIISLIFSSMTVLKVINSVAPILPKQIRTPIHWIHAMIFEWLTVCFVIPSLRYFNQKQAPLKTSKKPILLIHGYRKDASVWFYLRKQLAKTNPVYAITLPSHNQSIREYARAVKTKCEQIKRETGHEELVVIGHSMGGLVGALCALQSELISEVITIASPISGTHLAKMGRGENSREMELGSPLTTELTKAISSETRVRFYHIGTKTDHLVIPNRSALPGTYPEREFHFEDIGHASLLFSPRVATLITSWL